LLKIPNVIPLRSQQAFDELINSLKSLTKFYSILHYSTMH